jgi:spermidine synthase
MILLEELNTEFGNIRIVKSKTDGTCTYYQDKCFHSQVDGEGVSTCIYVHVMFSIIRQANASRVLMIGCAGGTLATMLHKLGCEVTVVDVNPYSFDIARRHFQMPETIECIVEDGFEFIMNSKETYDAVAIDAFSPDATIPLQFITKDFFRNVERILEPKGVVVMNVMTANDRDPQADRIALNMEDVGIPSMLYDWPGEKDRNTLITGGSIAHMRIPSGKEPAWAQRKMRGVTPRTAKSPAIRWWKS